MRDISERARELYTAFMAGDRPFLEDLFAEDFTFTSPYDDHIDRDAFFERCFPNRERMRAIHVCAVARTGDEVFVLYDCELREGPTFRNCERLVFHGERVRSVEVYFGDPPAGVPREDFLGLLSKVRAAA